MSQTEHQGFLRGAPPTGTSIGPLVVEPATFNIIATKSAFASLLKLEPAAGEEVRVEDTEGGDRYHGAATDGTPEITNAWRVVRFYRTAAGDIFRVRYRTGVAWTDKTSGWGA